MSKATNILYNAFKFSPELPKSKFFLLKTCILSIVFAFSSCDPGGGGNLLMFTPEDEKKLGDAIHTAMINSDNFNIMPESMDVNNYVRSVRTRLIGTGLMENLDSFEWNVYVILNDDVEDCFATVGGNIYVYSGLMKTLNNEAQFMGILAHEFYYADNSYHTNILRMNYPISILLEVSRGNDEAIAMEMLQSFYASPRNPNLVMEADNYGMGVICQTEMLAEEMPIAIENAHQSNNTWYENHKELDSESFTDRSNSLKGTAMTGCGRDQSNPIPYLSFLSILP